MVADHRYGHLESMRAALSAVVYPIQYLVNLPIEGGRWLSRSVVTRENLLRENTRLKEEQLLLSSKLQRFSVLEEENGAQVRGFLSRHDGFSIMPPGEVAQALGERAFLFGKAARMSHEGLTMTPRLTETDGFFVALLRRQ